MGAMTVEQICIQALHDLEVGAAGEPVDPDDLALVQTRFNLVIDQWKADRLMTYQVLRLTFTITTNTPSFSIGPGAVWGTSLEGIAMTTRPLAIVRAGFVNTYVNPSEPLETPIHCYTDEEWASIGLKTLTSTICWGLWYQTNWSQVAPTGDATVFVFPILTQTGTIALYVPLPIDEVADDETGLATTIYVPPGYRKAFIATLAIEAADAFGLAVGPNLMRKYVNAMRVVKRSNAKPMALRIPQALSRRGLKGGGFDILTNQSNW